MGLKSKLLLLIMLLTVILCIALEYNFQWHLYILGLIILGLVVKESSLKIISFGLASVALVEAVACEIVLAIYANSTGFDLFTVSALIYTIAGLCCALTVYLLKERWNLTLKLCRLMGKDETSEFVKKTGPCYSTAPLTYIFTLCILFNIITLIEHASFYAHFFGLPGEIAKFTRANYIFYDIYFPVYTSGKMLAVAVIIGAQMIYNTRSMQAKTA